MSCLRCGGPTAEQHHPSGRINGTYLDPGFTVEHCLDCHRGEHALRAALDLDKAAAPASLVEVVEVALRRVAVTLGRLGGPSWIAGMAEACRHWAEQLARFTFILDAALPMWRTAITQQEVHP